MWRSVTEKRHVKFSFGAIAWIMLAMTLSACPQIGILTSTETYMSVDEIQLKKERQDVLPVAEEVGKSLGYSVEGLDKFKKTISFNKQASSIAFLAIGKIGHVRIVVQDEGKAVRVEIFASGNLGTSGQEAATGMLNEFRDALSQRLT